MNRASNECCVQWLSPEETTYRLLAFLGGGMGAASLRLPTPGRWLVDAVYYLGTERSQLILGCCEFELSSPALVGWICFQRSR